MDLEWQPSFRKGEYHYTALLQLCNGSVAVLFRLHRLAYPHPQPIEPYGRYRLPKSLHTLLTHPHVLKVALARLTSRSSS